MNQLAAEDTIITFVNRRIEPMRLSPFIRAIPLFRRYVQRPILLWLEATRALLMAKSHLQDLGVISP